MFLFNNTVTTEIYTLSLHDALPISVQMVFAQATVDFSYRSFGLESEEDNVIQNAAHLDDFFEELLQLKVTTKGRSEEHTSELQSQSNLVYRLLLEKKKKNTNIIIY